MPGPLRLFEPLPATACPPELGGKAQGLWRLQQADLPVPAWWGLTPDWAEQSLLAAGLGLETRLAAWQAGAAAWSALAEQLPLTAQPGGKGTSSPFTHNPSAQPSEDPGAALQATLRDWLENVGDRAWAVRSSSVWEDAPQHSFAGLFSTIFVPAPGPADPLPTRVAALQAAILGCWRAMFSEAVWHYGRQFQLDPRQLQMAVILQELKRAEVSGVWFEVHPQGPWHQSLLIAGLGLGEGVVQNRVETDSWLFLRRERHWQAQTRPKQHKLVMTADGPQLQVLAEPQLSACLQPHHLDALQALLSKLPPGQGPQDVEWCLDREGLWLLQSRPITGLPPGAPLLLDASNIGESYPGVISPLTFSVVQHGYAVNFASTLQTLGMSAQRLKAYGPRLQQLVALVQGRIYYNLGQWQALLSLLPGLGQRAQASFAEMIGAEHLQPLPPEKPLASYQVYPRLLGVLLRLSLGQQRYFSKLEKQLQAFEQLELAPLNGSQLAEVYQQQFETLVSQLAPGLVNDLWLSLCMSLTRRAYLQASPEAPEAALAKWSQLLAGVSGLPSKAPLYALLALIPPLQAEPALKQGLQQALEREQDPTPWLVSQWPEWAQALQAYQTRYGFRVAHEFLLEQPSFQEEPQALYSWLLQLAEPGPGSPLSVEALRAQEAAQQITSAALIRELPRFQAMLVAGLLGRCFEAICRREQIRLFRARMMASSRRFFLHVGQRFQQAGLLNRQQDIFFLTEQEVLALLQQQAYLAPAELVQSRKQAQQSYQQADPGRFYACFSPYFPPRPEQTTAPIKAQDSAAAEKLSRQWQGLGGGGGLAEGQVLVCLSPPPPGAGMGKILVVPATDPGWMLHLLQAKGLIAEQGNLLSHAAILGRELGLPTVVGIPGICSQLQSGQQVRLNGQSGTLQVLS